jgi:hypothetical protein
VRDVHPALQVLRSRSLPDGSRVITVILNRTYEHRSELEGRPVWIEGQLCHCETVYDPENLELTKGARVALKVAKCPEDSMAPYHPSDSRR